MGYGGAFLWTGLIRNLKKKHPDKKIVLVFKRGIRDRLLGKRDSDHAVFKNNPDIDLIMPHYQYLSKKDKFEEDEWIVVDTGDKELLYWEDVTRDKIIFKRDRHAVEIMCAKYGIEKPSLKPVIRLTGEELMSVKILCEQHGLKPGDFISVEPGSKRSFTANKEWFFERWQELSTMLEGDFTIVQLGVRGSPVLSGAVDLTGWTSFREAAGIIASSKLFIGPEGGLMHAAAAAGTKSVILISGYEPLELFSYPDNFNLYGEMECAPCGLLTPCPIGRECMKKITVEIVYEACREKLR